MKELRQVREAVTAALERAGLAAVAAWPEGRAKRYDGPVAAVAVGAAQGGAMGFCNYLGQRRDPETQAVLEVYGKQIQAEIAVDIRGRRAAECERGCETAAEVLLGGLPGIRPGELNWEALEWERETELFLRRGKLSCRAVFQAETEEDQPVFLDFILKGVVTT